MKTTARVTRLNALLKREIADLLETRMEHHANSLVSVTDVEMSPDLRQARIYISYMGPIEGRHNLLDWLRKNRSDLQDRISRHVKIKYTPVLEFHLDDSMEKGSHVLSIIEELEHEHKTES